VRTRDPETKRQQLFEAALAEFAEYGLAGARVERLAKKAGISAGLVYSFYDGKEKLFDAVFDQIVELTIATIPIDADHLPQYAGSLYDGALERPDVIRFMAWYQLERDHGTQRAAVTEAMQAKVAAIKDAQGRGTVTSALPPGLILALVLGLAGLWNSPSEDLRALVREQDRRQAVVEAVDRLVRP
jgi:AcrR family transcriptional regulator